MDSPVEGLSTEFGLSAGAGLSTGPGTSELLSSGCESSSDGIRATTMATTAMMGHTPPATRKITHVGTTAAAGPARAMEMGISARDTKKSRLETRPSKCGGTRRCRSVPQRTIPMPPVAPKTNSAAATIQKLSMIPMAASGRLPAPHETIITVR